MSNIAVIFAGGTGQRMNTKTKPKQFLELHGKPIIVYTLEIFQEHDQIDGIVLVMLKEWIPYAKKLLKKYNLTKVVDVIPGGHTGQESIKNGVFRAGELYSHDSIILIHDGVRPLITAETITNDIECVHRFGNAITTAQAVETITINNEKNVVGNIVDRSKVEIAKAPQCFILRDLVDVENKAAADNQLSFIDTASLMKHYGHILYTVKGPRENIKITTPVDFYLFRAIMDARENLQIEGI